MARYLNVFEKKTLVVRKAYDVYDGHWLCEHDYMVSIETDDGRLLVLPVTCEDYLKDFTADEFLEECENDDMEILQPLDWKIKQGITEWIRNTAAVEASSLTEATCAVVSLLCKFGMWKDEYSNSIDVKNIRENGIEE